MKTKTLTFSMLGLMLSLVLGIQITKGQNTPAGVEQSEPVLSGSTLKSEDVMVKADAIFVGEIVEIGFPTAKAPGRGSYYGVQVKVLQVLRGSVDAQVTVTLYTTYSAHEQPPKVGNTYIFFAHKNTEPGWDNYTVVKLLPATDATITKVKGIIAQAPK
jgi:hypothetical protein